MKILHKYILLLTTCLLIIGCEKQAPIDKIIFKECAALSVGRSAAKGFSVDGYGYVFGGRLPDGSYTNELLRYSPTTDSWTIMDTPPMGARVHPTAIAVNDDVYIGLGYRGGGVYGESTYCQDFWRFTPSTGEWKRLADYPTTKSNAAASFISDGSIYVGLGCDGAPAEYLYRYIIAEDRWEKRSSVNDWFLNPVFLSIDGRGFAGWGYTSELKAVGGWYEYIPSEDRWIKRRTISGYTRTNAACLSAEGKMYVMGGYNFGGTMTDGFKYSDITEYNASEDRWIYRGELPQGKAENMITFAIDNYGYIGLGEVNGSVNGNLYKFKL